MKFYRVLFALAAIYNVAFGLWAGLCPQSFFRVFDLEPTNYPSIWACLGMVVGLYGVLYAAVAREPERGDLIVWVGLAGKVLGPLGWLWAVFTGELPPRTFPLILANDLVWWFPFMFYLLRRVLARRAIVTWLGVAIHVVACGLLLVVGGGTEAEPDPSARARWIADNAELWSTAWFVWSLASMSLLAFFAAWGGELIARSVARAPIVTAWLICAVGVSCDLAGETTNIVALTRTGLTVYEFIALARLNQILGMVIANGLYCTAGLIVSGVAWRVGWLRGWLGRLGFVMWIVGLGLSFAAITGHRAAIVGTGGAVMILFVPWAALIGWQLRVTTAKES